MTASESQFRLVAVGSASRVFQALLSLANVAILAQALGPTGRGEYFLFVAGVAVACRVVDLGRSTAAVVYFARYPESASQLHAIVLRFVLVVWVVAAIVAGAGLAILNTGLLSVAAIVVPFALYEYIWIHVMVGLRRVILMNSLQVAAALATIVLNGFLVVLVPGGVTAALAVFIVVLVVKVLSMLAISRTFSNDTSSTKAVLAMRREMFLFGLRGYPNSLASLLWTRVPAFILTAFHGPYAVGIFSTAQQLQEQSILPVQATQDAIYQQVTREPRATLTATLNRYLRIGLAGMLLVAIVAAALAPFVIPSALWSGVCRFGERVPDPAREHCRRRDSCLAEPVLHRTTRTSRPGVSYGLDTRRHGRWTVDCTCATIRRAWRCRSPCR